MAKKKVVEILEFSSVQEAQATKEKCEKRLKNYPLAKWIALAASVCGVIGGIAMIAGHGLQMLASPAVYALFLIPIIILRSIRKQISADLQAAELYLKGHNAEIDRVINIWYNKVGE